MTCEFKIIEDFKFDKNIFSYVRACHDAYMNVVIMFDSREYGYKNLTSTNTSSKELFGCISEAPPQIAIKERS